MSPRGVEHIGVGMRYHSGKPVHPSMSPRGVEHWLGQAASYYFRGCIHQCRREALSTRGRRVARCPRPVHPSMSPRGVEHIQPAKAGMFSGKQTDRGKSQRPVAWVALVEETKPMKPTDKAILGMVSKSSGRNPSEPIGGLENEKPRRPSPHFKGEGSMVLVQIGRSKRRTEVRSGGGALCCHDVTPDHCGIRLPWDRNCELEPRQDPIQIEVKSEMRRSR